MKTNVWWQNIIPSQEKVSEDFGRSITIDRDSMIRVIKQVARDDTVIARHDMPRSSYILSDSYMDMLNNAVLIDQLIEAETQGFDAAVIACCNDPGLREARQAVDIPVVAPMESSMLLACTLGHKFGIVTVQKELVPLQEERIRQYGLCDRAVPTRTMDLGDNPMEKVVGHVTHPESINPQFDEIARASIADGAEVIIVGCMSTAVATSLAGYKEVPDTGVPVIDPNQAAIKMAEQLADLKRTIGLGKSQYNYYRSMPKETRDHMRKLVAVRSESFSNH